MRRSAVRNSALSALSALGRPGRTPSSTSAWADPLRQRHLMNPKSYAVCSRVTPRPRSRATRTTSSRNSFGKVLTQRHPSAHPFEQANSDVTSPCSRPKDRGALTQCLHALCVSLGRRGSASKEGRSRVCRPSLLRCLRKGRPASESRSAPSCDRLGRRRRGGHHRKKAAFLIAGAGKILTAEARRSQGWFTCPRARSPRKFRVRCKDPFTTGQFQILMVFMAFPGR